jgi:AP endonuclease-2
MPDALGNVLNDLSTLDDEGRALTVDFGLFVLINVYCPNQTSDERLPFKYNFHKLLEDRVEKLIQEGREVIVLGDMNVVATPDDHCEGSLESRNNNFWGHPVRDWFHKWLDPEGPMVDVVRNSWPERKEMFTCEKLNSPIYWFLMLLVGWDTRTNARESNYGARIDYILLTKGLLPWFKHGDIQPDVRGSDHCPVFIDLYDEITLPDGQILRLVDKLAPLDKVGLHRDPPPISTKHWDEFSGKQKLLSTFFSKRSTTAMSDEPTLSGRHPQTSNTLSACELPTEGRLEDNTVLDTDSKIIFDSLPPINLSQPPTPILGLVSQSSTPSQDRKRKATGSTTRPIELKPKKLKKATAAGERAKQPKLAAFFAGPSTQSKMSKGRSSSPPIELSEDSDDGQVPLSSSQVESSIQALEISSAIPSSQPTNGASNKAAWSQLLKPLEPPRCTVHNATTKEFTVNKTGPNKGKKFFLCSM